MSQDTPSLQVRCTGCNTSFKMKLKRGRIPTKVVPCPKCKSPIDLSQYSEADIQTEQPLSGLAQRLRPAAELLKTIIPQARIFDRGKNRKRPTDGTPKVGPGFHLQKGGPNDDVSLPDRPIEKPAGMVVGRMSPASDAPESIDPVDLRETPAMGLEAARRLFPVDDSVDQLDSGVLVKIPDSVEIDLGPTTPQSLDVDSDAAALPDIFSGLLDSDVFDSITNAPELSDDKSAESVVQAELKLEAPKIQAPKLGPAEFKPPPKTAPSFKLPSPISGSSQSSESREKVTNPAKVELSDALRSAVEKQRFETATPAEDQSLELIREAKFSNEAEQEQADSFFKSSVQVAESMELEIEEFDMQEESRSPISMLAAIIFILVVLAAAIGFITLQ